MASAGGTVLTLWNLLQQHNNSQRWGDKLRTTDALVRWISSASCTRFWKVFLQRRSQSSQRGSRPRRQRHPEICRASGCSAGQKVPGARGWEQSWLGMVESGGVFDGCKHTFCSFLSHPHSDGDAPDLLLLLVAQWKGSPQDTFSNTAC